MQDAFDTDWTAKSPATIETWNAAMADYLNFSGSPVGDLEPVADETFLAGPVFCIAMKLLSGLDPCGSSVAKNIAAMEVAMASAPDAERAHAAAIRHMLAGEFSAAARTWDTILQDRPGDILALKCSHETWFLVGDAKSMLASTHAALARLDVDHPAYATAAAQHGFALEENGDYVSAEKWGKTAIEMAPTDCWALHCLAHVYETQNRHDDAMALLTTRRPIWSQQNLLNAHIWWHLALRQIEARKFDQALAIFDDTLWDVPASNRFRLTDGTSLLWRLELDGVDVGDRWQGLADKWAKNATLHTNAFLDLHAALAFARCPNAPAATTFFDSLDASFDRATDENAQTFHRVVKPLARAMARLRADPMRAADEIERLLPDLHRVGGSIVQRELVERSYSSALIATRQTERMDGWIGPKLDTHPNTPWLLRAGAKSAQIQGDTATETLLHRRADAAFMTG